MREIKERLESELSRVLERLQRTGPAPASAAWTVIFLDNPAGDDETDAGLTNLDRETDFASRSMLIARARRLARALERFDGGGYGLCEECGQPIGPARLGAMPEATTCVRCQQRAERAAAPRGPGITSRVAHRDSALE